MSGMIAGANGMYQNSVYGTAACLPMKYTNAVVLGSVSPYDRNAAEQTFSGATYRVYIKLSVYFRTSAAPWPQY